MTGCTDSYLAPSCSSFGGHSRQGSKAFPAALGQSSSLPEPLISLLFSLEHETWSLGAPPVQTPLK